MLFAAKAPECSSEFWRWQESATGGGLSAPGAAGVSTELCDWCNNRQLPSSASFLHHRVGKVCEEHRSKVCTNSCFALDKRWRLCFSNLRINVMVFELLKKTTLWHFYFFLPLHRKGLRVIPESEIGLAAIYASCDQYCNPSGLTADSGGRPHSKALVAFFILPIFFVLLFYCVNIFSVLCLCLWFRADSKSESQNTKCFAVTECGGGRDRVTCSISEHHSLCSQHRAVTGVPTSTYSHVSVACSSCLLHSSVCCRQPVWCVYLYLFIRTQQSKVTGVMAVGETPEKKQNQNASQLRGSKLVAQKTATQCVVADTMSSSFNTVENTDSQRKTKLTGTCMIELGINRSSFIV